MPSVETEPWTSHGVTTWSCALAPAAGLTAGTLVGVDSALEFSEDLIYDEYIAQMTWLPGRTSQVKLVQLTRSHWLR